MAGIVLASLLVMVLMYLIYSDGRRAGMAEGFELGNTVGQQMAFYAFEQGALYIDDDGNLTIDEDKAGGLHGCTFHVHGPGEAD